MHGHLSQRRHEAALEAGKLLREEVELQHLLIYVIAILDLPRRRALFLISWSQASADAPLARTFLALT